MAAQLSTVTSATEVVTPATARNWLGNNVSNRDIKRNQVEKLKREFLSGLYTHTADGIGFDVDGVVQNGQHRLIALSELPESTRMFFTVVRGLPREAFKNTDRGVPRSVADSLRLERKFSEVVKFGATISGKHLLGRRVTPHEASPFIEFFFDVHEKLREAFPGNTRVWSSAPIRSAACFAMRFGEREEYVKTQYKALCTGRLTEGSSATEALNVSFRNGIGRSPAHNLDACVRAFKAFREENGELRMIKLGKNELPETLAMMKQLMDDFNE